MANFPSRVYLQVSSKVDSRTILGRHGGRSSAHRGDMLFSPGGSPSQSDRRVLPKRRGSWKQRPTGYGARQRASTRCMGTLIKKEQEEQRSQRRQGVRSTNMTVIDAGRIASGNALMTKDD